jgi:hypothetical protein
MCDVGDATAAKAYCVKCKPQDAKVLHHAWSKEQLTAALETTKRVQALDPDHLRDVMNQEHAIFKESWPFRVERGCWLAIDAQSVRVVPSASEALPSLLSKASTEDWKVLFDKNKWRQSDDPLHAALFHAGLVAEKKQGGKLKWEKGDPAYLTLNVKGILNGQVRHMHMNACNYMCVCVCVCVCVCARARACARAVGGKG